MSKGVPFDFGLNHSKMSPKSRTVRFAQGKKMCGLHRNSLYTYIYRISNGIPHSQTPNVIALGIKRIPSRDFRRPISGLSHKSTTSKIGFRTVHASQTKITENYQREYKLYIYTNPKPLKSILIESYRMTHHNLI